MVKKEEFRFNLEIFKESANKEIKISNLPISKLKVVCDDLLEKYG